MAMLEQLKNYKAKTRGKGMNLFLLGSYNRLSCNSSKAG